MSELNPEVISQPVSQLAVEVLARTKTAYEILDGLRKSEDRADIFTPEHEQQDVKELEYALGIFAEAHLDDGLEQIPLLELPEEVTFSAEKMLKRLLTRKLNWAIFDQFEQREAAGITNLIGDKTVISTSLRYGHGHSDGYGVSSGSGPQRQNKTVIGKLLRVDPSLGQIWLGEPNDCYRVNLWRTDYDMATTANLGIRQQSTLEIVDDSKLASPSRIGRMAVFAAELQGHVSEAVIERGIMLELRSNAPNDLIRRALSSEN